MSVLDRVAVRVPPMAGIGVAVAAVSTSAILIRWSRAPSQVAAFYRVLFTTLLLAPVMGLRHGGAVRKLGRRDLLAAGLTGVALAVHFASWFESLAWTSVAASVTLVQSQPVFVAAGAALVLDEHVTRRTVLGIGVALVGMVGMSASDLFGAVGVGADPLYGNALAVLGAVMAGAYVISGRRLRQRLPLLPYVTVVYGACAVVLFVLVLASGAPVIAYPSREWLLFLGMAVGPGILGHTLINWSLGHLESSVVSVSLLGEPVGSTLLAVLLLGERPAVATVVGGVVVLAGIYLTTTARESI